LRIKLISFNFLQKVVIINSIAKNWKVEMYSLSFFEVERTLKVQFTNSSSLPFLDQKLT